MHTPEERPDRRTDRRRAPRTTAALAVTALTATLAAVPSVAATATATTTTATATTAAPAAAWAEGAARQLTLITGDRVLVDPRGRATTLIPADGRESIPVRVLRSGPSTLVLPQDVLPLIAEGTVDRRLFDITELSRAPYRSAEGLPLIVTYDGARAGTRAEVREATGDGPGSRTRLDAIDGEALTVAEDDLGALWNTLTRTAEPRTLAAAPGVAGVALDGLVEATLEESVPQIGAPAAWDAGYDGTGATIAVLDTGISDVHPDVSGRVIAERNFTDSPDTDDHQGHGTHVASIAAGTGAHSGGRFTGVAPGARLLDGKVLDDGGSGYESQIIEGMQWAVEQGADVVNMSLGGEAYDWVSPMDRAVNELSAASDTLFVVAAGNDGPDPGSVDTPGAADAALTVGAVDKQDALAGFSSVGPRLTDGAIKPDVTAPGVAIAAAASPGSAIEREGTPVADGYVAISGTSMATPHVAGAAALLTQLHPEWTGEELKAALTGTARPNEDHTPFQQGSGRVDVAAALDQTVITDPVSLSYGTVTSGDSPDGDVPPLTRELTYRNLGGQDVTLDLSATATAPDGGPAPAGAFALEADRVTIPAGGTATVGATVDLGPADPGGVYALAVTGSGEGQSVRTVGAVDRRVELSVTATGRDGAPTGAWNGIAVNLDSGAGFFLSGDEDGTGEAALPVGEYSVEVTVLEEPAAGGDPTGYSWLVAPTMTVSRDTTHRVNAADAAALSLTPPDDDAAPTELFVALTLQPTRGQIGYSSSWVVPPGLPDGFHTAQLGAVTDRWDARSVAYAEWRGEGAEYQLAATEDGALFTGVSERVRRSELARLTVRQGSPLPDRTGVLVTRPSFPTIAGAPPTGSLPRTSEVYVQADAADWGQTLWVSGPDGARDAVYFTPRYDSFQRGKRYERTFNTGVFGPSIGDPAEGLFRQGDLIFGTINPLGDGEGHSGWVDRVEGASTTLYRDGRKYATAPVPLDAFAFEVPPGEAAYRLVSTVRREGASTEVTAAYTFTSGSTPEEEPTALPATTVRFTPDLTLRSTSRAWRALLVPITPQGSAAGGNLERLAVSVSYDGGQRWHRTPVLFGRVLVVNPRPGGTVSFRAVATDRQGNTVTQTIIDAYRTT